MTADCINMGGTVHRASLTDAPTAAQAFMAAIWLALIVTFLIAFIAFLARVVTERRARSFYYAGICRHCHYDLRATPRRCPECGQRP